MNVIKRSSTLIFIFLIPFFFMGCKKAKVYSPENQIENKMIADTTIIQSFINRAISFSNVFPDSVNYYANEALQLSLKINYSKGVAQSYYYLGNAEWGKGNYLNSISYHKKAIESSNDSLIQASSMRGISLSLTYLNELGEAEKYLDQAVEIFKKFNKKNELTLAYTNYGMIESNKENFLQALTFYQKALQLADETNDSKNMSIILNNLGIIHQKLEMSLNALDYYQQAYDLVKGTDNVNLIAMLINNIATVYIDQDEFGKALEYIEEGLRITELSGNKRTRVFLLSSKAEAYLNLKDYNTALIYYQQAYNLGKEIGIKSTEPSIQIGMGKAYMSLGKTSKAIGELKDVLKKAKQQGNKEISKESSKLLSDIFYAQSDLTDAYLYLKLSNEMADSLPISKIIKQFTQMEMQYDFDKEQYKQQLAQQKINYENKRKLEKQQLLLFFLIAGFTIISLLVIIIYRGYRHKKILNKRLEDNFKQISEQKKVIENKNNDLEYLNSTKDKLFSIIAHDLTNPFHIILGFAEQLLAQYDIIDDDKRKHFIKEINRSSQNAFGLLRNMLTWAKAQQGYIEIDKKELNLKNFIDKSIQPYTNHADQKEITIENNIPDSLIVTLDKQTMAIVIGNLFINAVKFTCSGGKINFWHHLDNENIEIKITDTGVGITPDKIENLFLIGKNQSTLGTNREKGSGLGLIICQDFVERNGGSIYVESEQGKGSTFTINLPR